MENDSVNRKSIFLKIILTLGIFLAVIGIILIGSSLSIFLASLIYDMSEAEISQKLRAATDKNFILVVQFIGQLFTLFILPYFYFSYFRKEFFSDVNINFKRISIPFLLTTILIFSLFPIINILAEWNKQINFPAGIEETLIYLEESAKKMTEALLIVKSPLDFIITLIVIAVLPAIGEEFLFRGIVQNQLKSILNNHHLAIWIAAIIFSSIHFQFFGFFPRLFLGVIFGYLYFWSGNLLLPIFIHFLNNGLTLVATLLYKNKVVNVDPEYAEVPIWTAILCLVFIVYLLSAFKKYSQKDYESEINS